ncbi:helix-turn-helix domain-containing protein [Pseudodesulfovibrio pelocollis]|uniref:helix-turn-helix domain-containing protein n=1 Tax=Pseudodesulfovibrio pelocollis TaxID=3051432 RepID=UPI00255B397A|nr:helix-turn-helix domain-containing protein [Pseudodesulfovibrio sp. SB368]
MEGLKERDVALILDCTQRHVRRLKAEGTLRTYPVGNSLRFRRQDVIDYMEGEVTRDKYLTVKEVSERTGIAIPSLRYMIKNGRFRFKRLPKGQTRFLLYWPDCEERYLFKSYGNSAEVLSPELEKLLGLK